MTAEDTRRRSPGWMRQASSETLHGIAWSFVKAQETEDLSEAQEWLWRGLISELEYRQRRARPSWSSCACMLCIPPFPDRRPETEFPF